MKLELIDIAVRDKAPHPRPANRTVGHVRAALSETAARLPRPTTVHLPSGPISTPADTDADIDTALMLKAATIIARVKASSRRRPSALISGPFRRRQDSMFVVSPRYPASGPLPDGIPACAGTTSLEQHRNLSMPRSTLRCASVSPPARTAGATIAAASSI